MPHGVLPLASSRFDIPAFYKEARRVLKPHGVLAVWGYSLEVLESEGHPANAALLRLFESTLGPYWDPKRRIIDSQYAGETGSWRCAS